VHIHALVLDGVYAPDGAGQLRFWRDRTRQAPDLPRLLHRIARRIERLLARRGLASAPEAGEAVAVWTDDASRNVSRWSRTS
jgi:hypothetical protein